MEYPAPTPIPTTTNFNSSYFFDITDSAFNYETASKYFVKLTGGTITGLTSFLAGVNINGDLSCSRLNTNLTASDLAWQSIAGSTTIALNHTLNGTALLGSITNSGFGFLTNNTERARILSNGNFGIGNASPAYKLDVNGDINTSSLLRITRSTNGQSFNSTNGSSTCVLYHFNNGDCYFGTTTVNNLIMQSNNTARLIINGSTGAISGISSLTTASLITTTLNATQKIDSVLVNCQDSWSTGLSKDLLTIGNSSDSYGRWTWSVFNASSNFNSHMTLYNQNQNQYGINIGSGQVAGAAKGAMMVINGPNWDSAAITCGTSSPKATLHINGGKNSTVPSNYSYTPSGVNVAGGGTVNISLFCYWNAWIEGSLYCTSDRRLKNIIKPIDSDNAMNLLNVTAQWYNWKKDPNEQPQLGLIAQDLLRENLAGLTSLFENNDVEEDDPEFDLKSKTQLVVTYDKIPLYLLEIIKKLNNRIDELTKTIEIMRSYTPLKKHIDKNL